MNKQMLIIIAWCVTILVAFTGDVRATGIKSLDDITTGRLVVQTNTERQLLPLLDTQVDMTIQGLVAQVQVRQFFENPSSETIEAIYFFPLPDDSSVSQMQMRIGDRIINGTIKEKKVANTIYTEAKKAGKKAALMVQGRPNLFQSKVANIAPGETIEVMMLYHQPVRFIEDSFQIRFPSTLTPRYTPMNSEEIVETFYGQKSGIQLQADDMVHSIPEPVAIAENGSHQLSIEIDLNVGLPLARIHSSYHAIVSKQLAEGHYQVGLQNYQVNDRDFELVWQVEPSNIPRLMTFNEIDPSDPDYLYTQLVLLPPDAGQFEVLPRDVTFILDHSGSMEGQPIQQAKAAMLQAIQALQDQDRFNVIAFNDQYRSLFGGLTEAEPGPKGWAMAYVQDLDADGGTEMLPALREALSETTSSQSVRQVVFLTDGAIANEDQLFQLIHQSLGDARLFTVGIGAAPNSYFMRKSAQFGRGSYTFISKLSEVSARMQGLLEQLRYPAMQSVTVDFSEAVTYFPEQLPDLYQGEPLSLVIRRPAKTIQLAVRGQRAGTAWQANVTLTEAVSQQAMGIGKLWARAQINQLLDEQHITGQHDIHRDAVIALALEHQLLTSYTSFVAVEDVISRPAEQPLQSHKIPNLVPHGAQHFGYPATALGWQAQLMMGLVVLFLVRLFSLQTWRRS